MALPDPNQVAGKNIAIYDAYYKQVDPKGTGAIEAMVAAKFLKKTGLSDVVLSRIWDLSDPNGKGYLDRQGLFVALKLVGLAQAGHDINMRNIFMETNVPKVGDIPKIAQPTSIQAIPPTNADWSMKPQDREKYTTLFESLMPVNGLIPGNKVKGLLMESKLPLETLGRIWDLADQDKDGSLDKHEFIVAMHLVYQALDKRAIPTALPAELQKPKTPPNNGGFDSGSVDFVANFPKELPPPAVPPLPVSMPPAKPPMPRIPPTMPSVPSMSLIETDLMSAMSPPGNNQQTAPLISTDWVITPQEKIRYDQIFTTSDQDMDGLVSGLEIKDVFLKSGVPQQCLAHIWALCDTHQSGKLTSDQFALAMWLVERKKSGIEPPQVLAPNMIPPSVRGGASTIDPMGGATVIQQAPPQPTYSNPELEMISKEIEELAKERRTIETDIAQKEADIRIKSGEVRSLQSELDTLAATLKQLENQKGEAQKRLDDLKTQKTVLDAELKEVNDEIDVTKSQVNKIRDQCLKQESTIKDQESELDTKRSELQKLKDEESALEHQYEDSQKELDKLTCKLQDTQLEISQIKAMVSQLQESQRQMNDALAACKTAIEDNEPALVSEYILKLEPDFREARKTLEPKVEPKEDPFNDQTAGGVSGNSVGFGSDGFKSNGFSSDPFTNTNGSGGFSDGFGATSGTGFDDSFGSSFQSSSAKKDDPFSAGADPFNDSKIKAVTPDPSKDEFGSDPFAVLHAPTSSSSQGGLSPMQGQKSGPPARPESPIPALPPKKSKQPPPRPAPPRPLQGPGSSTKPSPSGFGDSGGSGGGGFADFADFDNKKVAATDSDFVEDPFKDYRYEDPFSIQDPFADDDIEVDPFSFDSPSKIDAAQPPTKINNNLKNITNDHHDGKKMSKTTTTTKVLNTSLSSVPTNNNHNNNNNNNNQTESFASFDAFSLESNTNTFKTTKSNAEAKSDFFDAFNDNFNKNMNKNSEAFDPFGTASGGGSGVGSTSAKSNFDDIFSDDSFSKLSSSSLSKSNHNSSNNNVDVNFAKFETEFTADFNSSELATTIPSNKNNLFSKYESNNNSKLSNLKINKNNLKKYEDQATASTKSKHLDAFGGGVGIGGSATKAPSNKPGDNFDADLEEALKRSLVEQ